MFFLLAFLISCEDLGFPDIAYVLTVPESILSQCKQLAEYNTKVVENNKKVCKSVKKGDEAYVYCQIFKKIKGFQCAVDTKINDEIPNIPDAQLAVFDVYTDTIEKLDFNKFKKQHDVILNFRARNSAKSLLEERDIFKFINNSFKRPKIQKSTKKTKDIIEKLSLVGNIGEKVHSLSIFGNTLQLEFIESDLNSDNLYLNGYILLKTSSKQIKSKKLVVDVLAHTEIFPLGVSSLVNVEQIGLDINDYYENPTIQFTNAGWFVNVKDSGSDVDSYFIKYDSAKTLGVISSSTQYVLYVEDASVTKVQDVNITLTYLDSYYFDFSDDASLLADEKETIQIGKAGVWTGITQNPTIYVNYDHDEYKLVCDESLKESIKEDEPYKYPKSKGKGPNVGLIVGIVVAVVVVIVIVVVVVIIVLRKKKQQDQSKSEGENV